MKRIFYAVIMLAVLTGCNHRGEQMLQVLDEQNVGMVIDNHGERTTYSAPGVADLLRLTSEEPERLQGAVVADRRVGKAAASLLITGGVRTVYTPLISTPAREMLQQAGIRVYAREEIPLMVNKAGTDLCPMESKLLDAHTAEECVFILRGGSALGIQMLQMLNKQGLSLLVYNHDRLTTHANRGVADLLRLASEEPDRLHGAIVADKIIGKAAAALMTAGGVREVHTNIICNPARELFEQHKIKVFATEEVPQILNRDRSSMCPIDTRLAHAETVEECVEILRNMPPRP